MAPSLLKTDHYKSVKSFIITLCAEGNQHRRTGVALLQEALFLQIKCGRFLTQNRPLLECQKTDLSLRRVGKANDIEARVKTAKETADRVDFLPGAAR